MKKMFPISLTFFVDSLSWAVVFPIFAPYFLDPTHHWVQSFSFRGQVFLLGLFLAAFSAGQFVGAPLLGAFADRMGRKKGLLISIGGTTLGLLLTAYGMRYDHLALLFAGRLFTGFFASNAVICLASLSDLSHDLKEKIHSFGLLSFLGGLSFVVGVFVGGKLGDKEIFPLFSYDLPLWIAAALSAVNGVVVALFFQETLVMSKVRSPYHIWRQVYENSALCHLFGVYFLFLIGWTVLLQFAPALAVHRYGFTSSNIADMALFMGVFWAIGSKYLGPFLLRKLRRETILEGSLLLFTAFLFLLRFPIGLPSILLVIAASVLIGGVSWPLTTAFIASNAPASLQGSILGLSQSTQALAMTLAPLLGGAAYQVITGGAFLLGGAAVLGATFLYLHLLSLSRRVYPR